MATLCAAAVAQPLEAQGTIRAGQTVSGRLDASDYVRDSDNTFYDDWFYEGRAGERVSVTQRSSDFDSWLLIGRVVNGEFHLDEFNDDAAGGDDARIEMTLPTTGRYVIRVNVVGRGRTGAYTLSVTSSAGSASTRPAGGMILSAGQSFTGALESSDAVWTDNTYYDLWRYQGRAGERVTIVMRSPSFNSYMQWGRMNGDAFSYIGGSSSRTVGGQQETVLDVTLPASGEYGIRANSHGRNTGRYTISVTSDLSATAGPSTPAGAQGGVTGSAGSRSVGLNQTVSGALDSSDSTMSDGTRYELWRFSGLAGQRFRITMRSSAFDPYMTIGTFANGSYSYIMGDDDGGEGTDARIEYTLPRSGEYAIRANSMGRATGPYTITLQTY